MSLPPRILVAPLNWGLGHATRCIPIIRELQKQGAEVFLACDGRPLELLKKEFPDLPALSLPDYGIRYDSDYMIWNLARSLPHLLSAISAEHRLMEKWVLEHRLDGIISDNRFGCFSRKVRSVFMTHQVFIQTPLPGFLEKMLWKLNASFILKFNECWVPDVAGEPNLSGVLSHLPLRPKGRSTGKPGSYIPLRYIGALSRMERFPVEKKYDVVAVISGPEPQRTRLENLFIEQAKLLPLRCLLVQGKTERQEHFFIPPLNHSAIQPFSHSTIEVHSHLPGAALNEAILSGKLCLSRSGYTTVMDLAKLGVPAVFIPTPGQTEQEYLAEHFHRQGIFFHQKQSEFNLKTALEEAGRFGGLRGDFFEENAVENAIKDFLSGV